RCRDIRHRPSLPTRRSSDLEEAVRLARATGDVWNEGWALGSLGRAALGRGALDDARAALEAGHSVAHQQSQLTALTAFILNLLGDRKSTRLNSSHQIISYAV